MQKAAHCGATLSEGHDASNKHRFDSGDKPPAQCGAERTYRRALDTYNTLLRKARQDYDIAYEAAWEDWRRKLKIEKDSLIDNTAKNCKIEDNNL